jgi:serine/threonine protein phosphatase PrpC
MIANLGTALEVVTATDPGMVRSHNEDSIGTDAEIGLAVLADGMGGYNAGEVASGIAVAMLSTEMKQALENSEPHAVDGSGETLAEKFVRENSAKANAAIFQTAKSQPQYSGMGTTLVVAIFYDNKMTVAHIGDSRLYRLRGDSMEQVTRDHSLLQEQLDSGLITPEEAKLSQNKNLVTRALGIDPTVEPEVHVYETQPDDTYLLCSDGLSDMVEDEEIRLTLITLKSNPNLTVQQLVQAANDNGGRDNISAMLIRVAEPFGVPRGWLARFTALLR